MGIRLIQTTMDWTRAARQFMISMLSAVSMLSIYEAGADFDDEEFEEYEPVAGDTSASVCGENLYQQAIPPPAHPNVTASSHGAHVSYRFTFFVFACAALIYIFFPTLFLHIVFSSVVIHLIRLVSLSLELI